MNNLIHLPFIQSIIRDSGIVVANTPSVRYPIPVAVFYRQNRDGSVGSLWPKGNLQAVASSLFNASPANEKWASSLQKIFFALGLERFVAHGKLILYADLPTATFLQQQWRRVS